jgi:hypothetical protein
MVRLKSVASRQVLVVEHPRSPRPVFHQPFEGYESYEYCEVSRLPGGLSSYATDERCFLPVRDYFSQSQCGKRA